MSQLSQPAFDRAFRASALRIVLACVAVAAAMGLSGAARNLSDAVVWCLEAVFGAGLGITLGRRLIPQAWYVDRVWLAALTIAAAISLPMYAIVLCQLAFLRHERLTAQLLEGSLPSVCGTTLAMTGLAFLVRERMPRTHAAAPGAPRPKFLARLPARLQGADLYAVEAEDHYLRLHTSLGQDLILLRLADAIAELEGLEGAQTHRSWWVARDAVAAAERMDGRAVLTLKDGSQAPVSRGFAKALREGGWF